MADTSAVRRRSAAIFGNEKVVEVVLTLERSPDPPAATAQDISRATGIAHSLVRDVLMRLAEGGAVLAVPKVGGSRAPQYYQPIGGQTWEALVRLAAAIEATDSARRA